MFHAVIQMPYEMAMRDELSRRQFYARAQNLVAERDRLREALRWTAAAFQAVANEADEFRIDAVKRTAREILDLADAALAQEQEK
ncbi:hypothetical protein CEY11_09270 [Candidimonas nitroreducens]|uniref:Uncharacterized protein n=2 Tax=Candidimonas nitroreducens TaxID=683354 RepID=A0A225MPY9_9BURK|nr:hypothetical protein CEY11_09270 [Candidimonas nitroreducens]